MIEFKGLYYVKDWAFHFYHEFQG